MALTYQMSTAQALANCLADLLDAADPTAGYVTLTTAGDVVASTLTFAVPAFGAATDQTTYAQCAVDNDPVVEDSSATGNANPATKCKFYDGYDSLLFDGVVGTTGTGEEITMSDNTIDAGQSVQLSTLYIRQSLS